ncbi:ABC transporter G family member 8 [Astathelohania contejeani]|uniref:ABC transporter G family member 8 n=1 Tax=Astathelohania contejeani TaxID=164912 RepID=A0ABQ7HYI8_9MICR|nr:ABC transporter G family member 8 [Thelohania contejeani]
MKLLLIMVLRKSFKVIIDKKFYVIFYLISWGMIYKWSNVYIKVSGSDKYLIKDVSGMLRYKSLNVIISKNNEELNSLMNVLSCNIHCFEGDLQSQFEVNKLTLISTPNLLENYTLQENIYFSTNIKETTNVLSISNLENLKNIKIKYLTSTDKHKIRIIIQVLNGNKILFINSKYMNIDLKEVLEFYKNIKLNFNITILFTLNNFDAKIFKVVDKILILWNGEMIYEGSPKSLESYLNSFNIVARFDYYEFLEQLFISDSSYDDTLINSCITKIPQLIKTMKLDHKVLIEKKNFPLKKIRKFNFSVIIEIIDLIILSIISNTIGVLFIIYYFIFMITFINEFSFDSILKQIINKEIYLNKLMLHILSPNMKIKLSLEPKDYIEIFSIEYSILIFIYIILTSFSQRFRFFYIHLKYKNYHLLVLFTSLIIFSLLLGIIQLFFLIILKWFNLIKNFYECFILFHLIICIFILLGCPKWFHHISFIFEFLISSNSKLNSSFYNFIINVIYKVTVIDRSNKKIFDSKIGKIIYGNEYIIGKKWLMKILLQNNGIYMVNEYKSLSKFLIVALLIFVIIHDTFLS